MRTLLIATAAALAAVVPAQAETFRAGGLRVDEPWSRPAGAGMNGAGFMILTNGGPKADALVAVDSPLADRVEIHQSTTDGGVARMQRLERVPLPAGQTVRFEPGGRHLMLIGLKAPLKLGDKAPATLTFASGAKIKIQLPVSRTAPAGHDHHAHH